MAKVLLTGATGFVGSVVLDKLIELNHSPVIVCRSVNQNLTDIGAIVIDTIDGKTNWKGSLDDCDMVIHCAARVHVMSDGIPDPLEKFREVNTFGTLNLAKQGAIAGVKRFIFISSIKVNGESTELGFPFKPDDDFIPIDPYGLSKYEAEQGLREIASETGMEVVIIRPPLVYGPGVKANFSAMMSLVSKGIPLPFGGITDNKRSYVSVDNLVDLIICCINHPNAANRTFLVSDDDDLSTSQMVRTLAQACGKRGIQLPIPVKLFELAGKITGKKDIVDRLCGSLQLDISETNKLLDWTPPISVEEGFANTAKHYLNKVKNNT